MTRAPKSIPDGFHTVTPYLIVEGAPELLTFLEQAFKAEELHRTMRPDGTIAHADIKIGDSVVMVSESTCDWKPRPGAAYLYVEDTDATYRRSLEAGAISIMEPADQFYGDRSAGVQDACGNYWWIATHIEDIAPEELQRRTEVALS